MSDIFIFICGAVTAMMFFILGVLFGAALKSQDRSITINLPDDFELEDAAAEPEIKPEGSETA
ncbi:MAG: hypothetical protein IJ520_09500 [Synergistaceae bacterium]|nr:hypothetical protein [Synergistaceae bacterium]